MTRTLLAFVCTFAFATAVFAQGIENLPPQTSYKEFRLLGPAPTNDPAGDISVPAATAVPEPQTWLLLAAGGLFVAVSATRRRAKN